MGERTNTIVEKTFSYDLPDDYLHQTNNAGLRGTFTYKGPDKVWVFVDNDTRKLVNGLFYTEHDDGDLIPTDPKHTKVCITADDEPELISMIVNQGYLDLPMKEEELPDGSYYRRIDPTPPDHTYELMECEYNLDTNSWIKPFPWKKPHMDWETLKMARFALLKDSDSVIRNNILSDEELEKMEIYRQTLRDIPSTFEGVDPWKVPFPDMPINLNNGAE